MLRNFVRYMPAAVAMLDREMRFIETSDRWCRDFSLTKGDTLGKSLYDVFSDCPEGWKEVHARCLGGETVCNNEERWERASGDSIWLRWEIRPWGQYNGKPQGVLIFSE